MRTIEPGKFHRKIAEMSKKAGYMKFIQDQKKIIQEHNEKLQEEYDEAQKKIDKIFYNKMFSAIMQGNEVSPKDQKKIDKLSDKQNRLREKIKDPDEAEERMEDVFAFAKQNNSIDGAGSTIYMQRKSAKKPFIEYEQTQEIIDSFNGLTAEDLTDKFYTNILLSNKPLNPIRAHQYVPKGVKQSPADAAAAIENIIDHDGKSVLWDLETFGNMANANGKRPGPRITEYSFHLIQGEIGGSENDIKYLSEPSEFSSVIGINKNTYEELSGLIDRYYENQDSITEDEMVTLKRLALHGGKKTKLGSYSETGVVNFESFSGEKDIGYTIDEMKKGLKLLREVGEFQETHKTADGMFGYEKQLLGVLDEIYHENLTVVGHNIAGFDINNLALGIVNESSTDAFKQQLETLLGKYGKKHLSFDYAFDDQQIEKYIENRPDFFLNKIFKGDKDKMREFSRWMRDEGKSTLTQEALLKSLEIAGIITPGNGVAHVATQDARNAAYLLYTEIGKLFDTRDEDSFINYTDGPYFEFDKDVNRFIFYATDGSRNTDEDSVMSFFHDNLTGQWRTSEAISVDEEGNVVKEGFRQSGLKRRASYRITGFGTISKDEKLYGTIAKARPDLDVGELYYAQFTPWTNSVSYSAQGNVVRVGSREQLSKWMNQNLVVAGLINDNAEFELFEGDEYSDIEKAVLSDITVDMNGNVGIKRIDEEELTRRSDLAFDNDAASRSVREKSYTKDKRAINFFKAIDEEIDKRTKASKTDPLATPISDVWDEFYANSKKIAKAVAEGKPLKLDSPEYKLSAYNLLGWDIKHEDGSVTRTTLSNTVDNVVNAESYYRSNMLMIEKAITAAEERGKDDPTLIAAYYKHIMEGLEEAAQFKENYVEKNIGTDVAKATKESLGYRVASRPLSEVINTYEVDISKLKGFGYESEIPNIFKISLSNTAFSNVDKLAKHLKHEEYDTAAKIQMYARFQDALARSGIAFDENDIIDVENDPLDIAGQKVVNGLRAYREENPTAGFLTPTTQHIVNETIEKENCGLLEDEIESVIAKRSKDTLILTSYKENEAKAKSLAEEIVDKILFKKTGEFDYTKKKEFIENLISKGYSTSDAERIYQSYIIKRNDTLSFVTDIMHGVLDNGAEVIIKDGRTYLRETNEAIGKEFILPKEVFNDGSFHIMVGENRTEYIDPIGLYSLKNADSSGERLGVSSITGKVHSRYGQRRINNIFRHNLEKKNGGTVYEGLTDIIKRWNESYRSYASILQGDLQDSRMANTFSWSDIVFHIEELGKTKAAQKLKNSDKRHHRILYRLLTDQETMESELLKKRVIEKGFSGLGYEYQSAVMQSLHEISEMIDEVIQENKDFYSSTLKDQMIYVVGHDGSSHGMSFFTQDTYNAGQLTWDNKTGAEDKMARALAFNADKANEDLSGRGNVLGSALRTKYQHAIATRSYVNAGYNMETTITGNRLAIETSDFKKIVEYALNTGVIEEDDYLHKVLTLSSTTEGAGMLSSYLIDSALSSRTYVQKVDPEKLGLSSEEEYDEVFRKLDSGELHLTRNANGNIAYKQGTGKFFRKGDKMLSLKVEYTGVNSPVLAKEDGFLRAGIFDGSTLLSEERVSEILNEHKDELVGEDWRQKAYRILEEKGLKRRFYLDAAEAVSNPKIMDYKEKVVGRSLAAGLGDIDENVRKFLEDIHATRLRGKVIKKDILEEFATAVEENAEARYMKHDLSKTMLGLMINSGREAKKQLSGRAIGDALIDNQIYGEEFRKRIFAERHQATEKLEMLMRTIGFLDDGQHLDLVSQPFPGLKKHGQTTNIAALINTMRYGGAISVDQNGQVIRRMTDEAIVKELEPVLGKGVAKANPNDYIEYGSSSINLDELDKLRIKYGLAQKDKEGNVVSNLIKTDKVGLGIKAITEATEMSSLPNLDRQEINTLLGKTIKIDERVMSNFRVNRYSQRLIDSAEKTFSNIDAQYLDKNTASAIYSKYFKDRKAGEVINKGFIDNVNEHAFFTEGENRLYDEASTNLGIKEIKSAVKELNEIGMSKEDIKVVMDSFKARGARTISTGSVRNAYQAAIFTQARAFNDGTHGWAPEKLTEQKYINSKGKEVNAGWKLLKLDDASVAANTSGLSTSIYGNNVVLDLHSDLLERKGAKQIYTTDAERYIALPSSLPGRKNEKGEVLKDPFQSKVAQLKRRYEDYTSNYESMTENERTDKMSELRDLRKGIIDAISVETSSKAGVLKAAATAHFGEFFRGTAQAFKFTGNEKGQFAKMSFDGVNLMKQAQFKNELLARGKKNGYLEMDFSVLSEEVRDSWFGDNYFEQIAGSDKKFQKILKQTTFDTLETEGTITNSLRYPAIYPNSLSATPTYISNAVKGDQAFISESAWLLRKGDWDSDKLTAILQKDAAEITINGKTTKARIDYGTYQALMKMNDNGEYAGKIGVKFWGTRWKQDLTQESGYFNDESVAFNSAKASIFHSAFDLNPYAGSKDHTIKMDSLDTSYLRDRTYDGVHAIDLSMDQYSPDEANELMSVFDNFKKSYELTDNAYTLDSEGKKVLKEGAEYKKGLREYAKEYSTEHGIKKSRLIESMRLNAYESTIRSRNSSLVGKSASGILDSTLYDMFRAIGMSGINKNDEEVITQTVRIAVNESALTAKSDNGEEDIERATKISKAWENFKHAASHEPEKRQQATNDLMDVLHPLLEARKDKEISKLSLDYGKNDKEKLETIERKMRSTFEDISTKGYTQAVSRLGVGVYGPASNIALAANSNTEDMLMRQATATNDLVQRMGGDAPINIVQSPTINKAGELKKAAEAARKSTDKAMKEHLDNIDSSYAVSARGARAAAKLSQANTMTALKKMGGVFGRGGMGTAAVAVAGGLLLSGFASGNRRNAGPAPAQTQADGAHSDEQVQMQQAPSLADSNLNVMRGGPNSGYVININASSPRGQQAAIDAIANAASTMTPRTGSVNLSINTSIHDKMSQFQVNKMVANAIGLA